MAANLFTTTALGSATYGTPSISGLIVTSFTVNESASVTEVKDDQGSVVAIAVAEPIKEISIEGMRTGTFTATVGATLAVVMPASVTLGATTIVTGLESKFASEQFETVSLSAKSYVATMT
jgi:hypothetical protein